MGYKFKYEEGQTAIERLRNYLSTTYTVISILNDEKAVDTDISDAIKKAGEDFEIIQMLLDDIDLDYEKRCN